MAAAALASKSTPMISRLSNVLRNTNKLAEGVRLVDSVPAEIVDDIFSHALKKQTGRPCSGAPCWLPATLATDHH